MQIIVVFASGLHIQPQMTPRFSDDRNNRDSELETRRELGEKAATNLRATSAER